jgi:beta-lactamase class A
MIAAVTLLLLAQSAPLREAFETTAATSGGRVGVYAEVVETHGTAGLNEDERFPMQSVYKLPICMAVLDEVTRGEFPLTREIRIRAEDLAPAGLHSPIRDAHPQGGVFRIEELIHAAIAESDGTASDVLLKLAGGPVAATAYLRRLGIRDMEIATTEAEMARDPMAQYRNFSTPRAAVALLKTLSSDDKVPPTTRELLLTELTRSTPGPHRIKGLLPPGTPVAHKTGTDGTHNGLTRATNDIGIVTLPDGRRLAIAVLVKDSTADEPTREATIATIAKAAFDAWRHE